jgi:hypothetical protein
MPDDPFEKLADMTERAQSDAPAPSSIKARLYSALIARQQQEGPLKDLSTTATDGRKLCVFEQLVQIAPVGHTAKQVFYCQVCHARVVAEMFDNPPIYWPHCPYAELKNKP